MLHRFIMLTRVLLFKFIFFLLILPDLFSCTNKKEIEEDITVEYHEFEIEVDEGPEKEITRTFKTVQDWLQHIAVNEKPNDPDLDYNFRLSESSTEYILSIAGVKTFEEGKYRTVTRIEWRPENMYLLLPDSEHSNLSQEQVREKVYNQIKDFTETYTFKSSFFSKAKAITADWKSDTIWKQ
jgi:hypothetical protein